MTIIDPIDDGGVVVGSFEEEGGVVVATTKKEGRGEDGWTAGMADESAILGDGVAVLILGVGGGGGIVVARGEGACVLRSGGFPHDRGGLCHERGGLCPGPLPLHSPLALPVFDLVLLVLLVDFGW